MELHHFEKEYRVHVFDTVPDGRLSLPSLFNYMQDIASDHAILLGFGRDDMMRENWFWVLSRMYVEIKIWPYWEDSLIIKTWPNGTDRLFALRNYEVSYRDGRKIADGTSSWLILDRNTKRVQRPDSALSHFNRNSEPLPSPLRYSDKLLPAGEDHSISSSFRVKISDLDVNLHTNNVKYLQWINDTYNIDFAMKNVPQSAEINYLSESLFNDEIYIKTSEDINNNGFYNHSVCRINDNKELCRARIAWKENTLNQV